MASDEQLVEWRREFEVSLTFDKYELTFKGANARRTDGLYADPYIEAAWRGFQMGMENAEDALDRFHPLRYISIGLVGAVKDHSEYDLSGEDELQLHDRIRSVLIACKETPL